MDLILFTLESFDFSNSSLGFQKRSSEHIHHARSLRVSDVRIHSRPSSLSQHWQYLNMMHNQCWICHTRANRFYWLTKQILWSFHWTKCSWAGDHCLCLSLSVQSYTIQGCDALIWLVLICDRRKIYTFDLVCDWECTWKHNPCAFVSLSHSWSLGGTVWITYPGTSAVWFLRWWACFALKW